jgi:hypothetical protein
MSDCTSAPTMPRSSGDWRTAGPGTSPLKVLLRVGSRAHLVATNDLKAFWPPEE